MRRAARGLAKVLGGLAVAALALLCGAALALGTDDGQTWLAARVEEQLAARFAGTFRVARVAVRPDGLTLRRVVIEAPGGARVIEAERVELGLLPDPAGWQALRFHVRRLELVGARVLVELPDGEVGPTLVRAFAPRAPSAPAPGGPATTFRVSIDSLVIDRGSVVVRAPELPPIVALRGLHAELTGSVDEAGVTARGTLSAELHAPVRGAATVLLDGALDEGFRALSFQALQASLGESRAKLHGRMDLQTLEGEALGLTLHVAPADVPGVTAGWRPTEPIEAEGELRYEAGRLVVGLDADASAGGARLDGALTLGLGAPRWKAKLETVELDLRAFDARAPQSSLTLIAELEGTGLDPARLSTSGRVRLAETTVADVPIGPAIFDGAWEEGTLRVDRLEADLPGARVVADGVVDAARVDGAFRLEARDTAALLSAIARLGKAFSLELPPLPDVRGALRVEGHARGPLRGPAIDGRVTSARIDGLGIGLTGLDLQVELAGLPERPRGTLLGRVGGLTRAGLQLKELRVDLSLTGREADGELAAVTPLGPLRVQTRAGYTARFAEITVRQLRLEWPGARWESTGTAIVRTGVVPAIEGLALRDEAGGSLAFDGSFAPGRLSARLRTTALRLHSLPAELLPRSEEVAGRLTLDATLGGTVARPKGTLTLAVVEGAARGFKGLQLDVEGGVEDGRVRATARLVRAKTRATITLDAPLDGDRRAPVSGRGELVGLPLDELAEGLGLQRRLGGTASGRLELAGTLDAPLGTIELQGEGLQGFADERVDGRGTLVVTKESLALELSLAEAGATLALTASLGMGSGALLAAGPTLEARLRAAPFTLEGTLEGLELAALRKRTFAERLGLPPGAAGRLALDAALTGSLDRPRGRVGARGVQLSLGGPALDGEVTLEAEASTLRLVVATRLQQQPLLAGRLEALVAPEALLQGDAWERATLDGGFTIARRSLGAVVALAGARSPVDGELEGAFAIKGTAQAPIFEAGLVVEGLRAQKEALGRIGATARYEAGAVRADVTLTQPGGGTFSLGARAAQALGLEALRDGTLAKMSVDALAWSGSARRFELAGLAPLSADIRTLEGRLDGDVEVSGRWPAPQLTGWLTLGQGRLSYTNFGDLRELSAELAFTPLRAEVKRLHARSGGELTIEGAATRASPEAPWRLDFEVDARRFGVVANDLTRAWLDADAKLTGELQAGRLDAVLELASGRVALPTTPSKAVQALEEHRDFLVVRRGESLAGARRRVAREAGAPQRSASRLDELELKVALRTREAIDLQGIDVDVPIRFDGLKVAWVHQKLGLSGRIVADEGKLQVMSRRFEIGHLNVIWTGNEAPGDPRLDVEALHESSYAKVTVNVGGTAQRPITQLRSNPPLSEAEIATLLATGRPEPKHGAGGGEASGAASALGAIATAQLKQGLAAKLPVDVLSFAAGEDDVFTGSTLEAGTYLSDRVYVGYSRTFDLESDARRNTNEVTVEYQLANEWTLEAAYGDAQSGGVDLFWSRDF